MDLELTPDQRDLHALARRFLDSRVGLALAREFLEGRTDATELIAEVRELGWYGAGLSEDDTFGLPGLVLIAEQVGAHAAPLPLVETAVAARIAHAVSRRDSLLERVAKGEAAAALAALEAGVDWSLKQVDCEAVAVEAGYELTGTKLDVALAESVEAIAVIAADAEARLGCFFVEPTAAGVSLTPTPSFDPSRPPVRLMLERVSVPHERALLDETVITDAFMIGAVLTAAEGLGASTAALQLAVEYANERVQYGRPIGQFQSLQHLLAEAYTTKEAAWSSILYAAAALDDDTDDRRESVAIAKHYGSRTSRSVVEAALQVFGGIGFTWEHDLHLLQRRVIECERRFGDAIHHASVIDAALSTRLEPVAAALDTVIPGC
jgi:alkylation response protein AidB-like acyl-CoA dehydrogenase